MIFVLGQVLEVTQIKQYNAVGLGCCNCSYPPPPPPPPIYRAWRNSCQCELPVQPVKLCVCLQADIQFLMARFDSLERRFKQQQEQQSALLHSFSLDHGMYQLTLTNEYTSAAFPSTTLVPMDSAPSPTAAALNASLNSVVLPSTPHATSPSRAALAFAAANPGHVAMSLSPSPTATAPPPAGRVFSAPPPVLVKVADSVPAPAVDSAYSAPEPEAAADAVAAAAAAAAAAEAAPEPKVPAAPAVQELLQQPKAQPLDTASVPLDTESVPLDTASAPLPRPPRYPMSRPEVATPFDNPTVANPNAAQVWQSNLFTNGDPNTTNTSTSSRNNALEIPFRDFRHGFSQPSSSAAQSQRDAKGDLLHFSVNPSLATSIHNSPQPNSRTPTGCVGNGNTAASGSGATQPPADQLRAPRQLQDSIPTEDPHVSEAGPAQPHNNEAAKPPQPQEQAQGRKPPAKARGTNRRGEARKKVQSLDTLCDIISGHCSAAGKVSSSNGGSNGSRVTPRGPRPPGPFIINLKGRSLAIDLYAQRNQKLPEEVQPKDDPRMSRGTLGLLGTGTSELGGTKGGYTGQAPGSTGSTKSTPSRPSSPITFQVMGTSVSSLSAVSRRPMVHLRRRGSFAVEPLAANSGGRRLMPSTSEYGAGEFFCLLSYPYQLCLFF